MYSGQYVKSDLIVGWKPDISCAVADCILADTAHPPAPSVKSARKMLTGLSVPRCLEITDL